MMTEQKTLTSYFDKIHCINLTKRIDRWKTVKEEFKKYNINDVVRCEAIDGYKFDWSNVPHNLKLLKGELGLLETHINIISEAIANNYDSILIFEDDAKFNDDIINIEKYMELVPTDWDMIYFGGNHSYGKPPVKIIDNVYRLNHTYTTHCIAIKKNMYETVLKLIQNREKQIDVYYADLQNTHNIYGFVPSLVTQAVGFSDIQQSLKDYTNLI